MSLPVAGEKAAPTKSNDEMTTLPQKEVYTKKAAPTQGELESSAMTAKVDMSQFLWAVHQWVLKRELICQFKIGFI